MPRIPKAYPHKGWYRTNAGGVQGYKLCPVEEGLAKATRELQVYLGKLALTREGGGSPAPVGAGIRADAPRDKPVGEVHDEFLDVKKTECEPATYEHYVSKLKPFLERFGHRTIGSLTEQDGIGFKKWVLTDREWTRGGKKPGQKSKKVRGVGPTTCNHYIRSAKTLLTWAAHQKRKYILSNPWEDIELLKEKPRERLITESRSRPRRWAMRTSPPR